MREQLEKIKSQALADIHAALDNVSLDAVRVRVLGKKGELTALLKQMGKLSPEERPVMGQLTNSVRAALEEKLEERKTELAAAALEEKLAAEAVDVTIPGKEIEMGHQHPMNKVLQEVKEIFIGMGYQIVDGPEVEEAAYNFTRLNIEEGHPSRDRSDTFYFDDNDEVLLRTQTSPMQIRVMEQQKPPIRILAPGRVFRKDEADATHSPMFHQIEGLVVDEGITMGDLKGALETLISGCTARTPSSASARTTSPSPSRAARSICSASSATARAKRTVRSAPPATARAGSSCWAPAWCIRRCSRAAALTQRSIPALPSASVWSAWPWAVCASTIFA